jgi:toxin ParE1/3/4
MTSNARRLETSPRARADLADIRRYTLEQWGLAQAERYIASIDAVARNLADGTVKGRPTTYIDLLKYKSGSHVIYFKISRLSLIMVRILHAKMDVDSHV